MPPLAKSDSDRNPVYYKLQRIIQANIEERHWEPGDAIPPERKLADEYQVSIGTVKKAILNLVNDGYLYRIQGKGTFVAGTALNPDSLRYYRCMDDFDFPEVPIAVQFLGMRLMSPPENIRMALNIGETDRCYELKRLFLTETKPLVYSVSLMPEYIFPNLESVEESRFEKEPLYLLIERDYSIPTIFNRELFGAETGDRERSVVLGVQEGSPLLTIDMISYTYRDRPYEYRMSCCAAGNRKVYREMRM